MARPLKHYEHQLQSFQTATWLKRNHTQKITQSNSWSFLIHKTQLNLFPDMTFHRIPTRAILGKFIFRNNNISTKCKNTNVTCLQFGTIWNKVLKNENLWKKTFLKNWSCPIGPIIKYKNNWEGTLILVKVAGWSAASLELTLLPKWCKLWRIQDKTHFQVVLLCFSSFLTTRIFPNIKF